MVFMCNVTSFDNKRINVHDLLSFYDIWTIELASVVKSNPDYDFYVTKSMGKTPTHEIMWLMKQAMLGL